MHSQLFYFITQVYLDSFTPFLLMFHIIRTIDTITIAAEFTIGKTVTIPVEVINSVLITNINL